MITEIKENNTSYSKIEEFTKYCEENIDKYNEMVTKAQDQYKQYVIGIKSCIPSEQIIANRYSVITKFLFESNKRRNITDNDKTIFIINILFFDPEIFASTLNSANSSYNKDNDKVNYILEQYGILQNDNYPYDLKYQLVLFKIAELKLIQDQNKDNYRINVPSYRHSRTNKKNW